MDKYVTALLAGNIAASTSLQEAKAPEWVMLIPAGRIDTNDGRFFNNDNPDGVIAAFAANKLDLPFDFEHGSETVATRGEFAPAAGWIKELANREGAIFGRVEWTARGRAAIEAKEVKYVSPAFLYEGDMNVVSLTSAALTVRPAISVLPALASQQPSLKQYVPRADYDALAERCTRAEAALANRDTSDLKTEAEALLASGMRDGKIPPASKTMYLRLCATREGLDDFKTYLASAPKIVNTAALGDNPKFTASQRSVTSEAVKIGAVMGVSENDLRKYAVVESQVEV